MKKADKLLRAARARALLGMDGGQTEVESITKRAKESLPEAQVPRDESPAKTIRASRGDVGQGRSFDVLLVPPLKWPKLHPPGSLTMNTPVWYKGERYYVEWAPDEWSHGTGVRISSRHIPDGVIEHDPLTKIASVFHNGQERLTDKRESFFVYPDELTLAPVLSKSAELTGRTVSKNQAEAKVRGDKDIGDPVALMLRKAVTLDDVYRIGAKYLSVKEVDLRAKYGHLNPGQQRMNVGNRMRGKWRKEQRM